MSKVMSDKGIQWVVEDPNQKNVFWPSDALKKKSNLSDPKVYEESAKDTVAFWGNLAKEGITWFKPWTETYWSDPSSLSYKWFVGGKLNISYNALDRHLNSSKRNKAAIIWVPEPLTEKTRVLTYYDLYREVNKFANALKSLGVKKGDRVGIYMPMIPEVQIALLACTRIGAAHSVVFSAFSPQSLKERLVDAEAKILVTADGYYYRGKPVNLKANADLGVEGTSVKDVIVVKRTGADVNFVKSRDHWWGELMENVATNCEPEVMDSEDLNFLLYTSGSTGRPKGTEQHIGGYAVQAYWTAKWAFDIHDEDIYWCTADIGWITGHTYNCYGPLLNGATMVVYEGAIDSPSPDRWWRIVEEHNVTIFYTAPTAIRMLMKMGDEWPKKHDLTSLRLIATVGEPINEEAWLWYFRTIGGGRCPIIDTWWQTETGGTLIHSLPGIGPYIPSVAGRPIPGTKFSILTEDGKPTEIGEGGYLVQRSPFNPSLLRTIWKNPEKFKSEYWSVYGANTYYTSDGAFFFDKMGNIRLTGRVDDVMKVAGHRLSTAEVENAITQHPAIVECAVIAAPHDIKGEVPVAFVVLKPGYTLSPELEAELRKTVDKFIGPTARPERIIPVDDLPKTRSGKIMRRILKSLIKNTPVGDITTLQNPDSVQSIKERVGYKEQA
ncbi:MAG: acetate--CoA ligase [Candidatus Bathyarchaeota archaeon]